MFKRTITGESLFFTYFRAAAGEGEVGFAGSYPGRLEAMKLEPQRSLLVQRDAFVCAESSVGFDVALVKRLGAGFFGGEGLSTAAEISCASTSGPERLCRSTPAASWASTTR